MVEVLKKIVDRRLARINKDGLSFGFDIPKDRKLPVIKPDFKQGVIISEVKRGSPSEGKMNDIKDPIKWVSNYIDGGANIISVLTEMDFFLGSIGDLTKIKKTFPNMAILRKDFLLYEEEVEISYKIGSDMVLLIAAILDWDSLKKMKVRADLLGILPLIEVHNEKELDMVLPLKPQLIGINSRDLNTFRIDKNYPFALKRIIELDNQKNSYQTSIVFESGVKSQIDSFFISNSGFKGILVCSSIVKSEDSTNQIKLLKNGFQIGSKYNSRFYDKIFYKYYIEKRVVFKICGITNITDAMYCVKSGVDILGFIFAESKREISIESAKEILSQIGDSVLKVGVVVDKNIDGVVKLVKDGWLNAIQFHNDFTDEECMAFGVCYYKAVRVKDKNDIDNNWHSPMVLFDAFSTEAMGGTGKTIDKNILDYAKSKNINLALAGGITPQNIDEILNLYNPMLVDISSGVEEYPGKKDFNKIDLIKRSVDNFKGRS